MEAEAEWVRTTLQRHAEATGQQLVVANPVPFDSRGFEFFSPLFAVEARGDSGGVRLVAKILPLQEVDHYLSARDLYRNESLFYGAFLRFLVDTAVRGEAGLHPIQRIESLFPKLFCAHEDERQCLLALEDLTPLGFEHAPKILDLAHMKLALQELGGFHALSYIAKKRNPEMFFDLVKRLNPWDEEKCQQYSLLIRGMVRFAADLFRASHPADARKHADRLAALDALADQFVKLTEPEEPLAVLCHGDYNRNNVMFKYDAGGRPTSLKMFDLQLATYSSPAIDLSLVLFMSTSPEVRDAHWDELFDAYHRSLADTVAQSGVVETEYSKEAMARDFGRFCVHGFLVTTFFLPATMMGPEDSLRVARECPRETSAARLALQQQLCSDEVKRRLAGLLKVMLDRNFL
ncbi:uncharacterized protein LOC134537095 [Bacillus rossius redtenbacheri]|uniref:uncharacterized protein LOC134537095 n=1 Tax=Bacillus rossius redtenbacheri TaxID=93214 RepID=UPI002FDED239